MPWQIISIVDIPQSLSPPRSSAYISKLFSGRTFASENHSLAINSVKNQLEKCQPLPCLSPLPEEIQRQVETLASIKKKELLRGCTGNLQPKYANLVKKWSITLSKQRTKALSFRLRNSGVKKLTFSVDMFTPSEIIKDIFNNYLNNHK
jgi:hypothetical protein